MAANSGAQELARKYRLKYGIEMPTLKLARIMYAENNLRFSNVEHARTTLRKIEGKAGAKLRDKLANKDFVRLEPRPHNPYNLPKSDETIYEPYIITGSRILVLSDIHIPYHSIPAITAAFDWAKDKDVDTILLNGDTIDAHKLSKYVTDPKKRDFAGELETFREFFAVLTETFPKAKVILKIGNHEERYNAFLAMKAGELSGVHEFSLENIIRARANGIDFVTDKRIMKAGDLNIIHGHEFTGGSFSPVNIARGLFLKAKVSAMQGHNHQTSEHTETDMNGRITTTWSVGCLSELHPMYMPLNKWNHGFAFVEVQDDGDFQVHNKRIHKGEVL